MFFYFPNGSEFGLATINRIMSSATLSRSRYVKAAAEWLDHNVNPNVFVVATLKQSLVSSYNGYSQRVTGNENIYNGACRQALCRFSRELYGTTAWKRYRRIVPNIPTLEGNGCGRRLSNVHSPRSLEFVNATQSVGKKVRFHYNILLQRPDWIDLGNFEAKFRKSWTGNPWAMPDLFFEERSGDCVSYALKEGPEALDVMSLSF